MEIHFNAYKCKYDSLNSWIKPYTNTMNINKVRIFINMDDFFHTLFKPTINNEFETYGKEVHKQFLSNVFNLLGHYRNWALKNRYDVEVYGFYSSADVFKNHIYHEEYRKKASSYLHSNKYFYIRDAIMNSLEMIQFICNYIPKIYMIDTKYLEPSILPLYITQSKEKVDLNILFSRDIYDLQYAYQDKWVYISPKGDNSSFIHRGNMWQYINYKEHIYSEDIELNYPYNMLILAKAIVGDKYRDIPRLRSIGWKTLFKYLNQIQLRVEEDSYILLEMELKELLKGRLINDALLQKSISCIDIEEQVSILTEIDKMIIDRQIIDIEDYENLKMLNKTRFSSYPLNLKMLCDVPITNSSHINQWK